MEDLLLALVTLLIFVSMHLGTTTKKHFVSSESSSASEEIIEYVDAGEDFQITPILDENVIIDIYKSDSHDKRERLVFALNDIAEYIDTSEFMEKHPYIHDYIFSSV